MLWNLHFLIKIRGDYSDCVTSTNINYDVPGCQWTFDCDINYSGSCDDFGSHCSSLSSDMANCILRYDYCFDKMNKFC